MRNSDYLEKINIQVELCDATGRGIGNTSSLMCDIVTGTGKGPDNTGDNTIAARYHLAKQQYLAIARPIQ